MKKRIQLPINRAAQQMARERGGNTQEADALRKRIDGLERPLRTLENKLSHTEALLNRVNTTMNTNFRRLHPNRTILEVT
jgi:hypothetical protein